MKLWLVMMGTEDRYNKISLLNIKGMLLQQMFVSYIGYNEKNTTRWNTEHYT
jgi:hypothetical protein